MMQDRVRIAILASGSGTNAQRLMEHFKDHALAEVVLVGCDQPQAGVVQRAWDQNVPCLLFSGKELREGLVLEEFRGMNVRLVVLAGFLRLIPVAMVREFAGRMVNIHPALLPKHGGRGMYGAFVHQAVLNAGEGTSGITIHLVDEHYDQGEHLAQVECPVLPDDTPDSLAARIHALEHAHYPRVVEELVMRLANDGGKEHRDSDLQG